MTLRIYVGYALKPAPAAVPGGAGWLDIADPARPGAPPAGGPYARTLAEVRLWARDRGRGTGALDVHGARDWLVGACGQVQGDGFGPRRPPFVLLGWRPADMLAALVGDCARAGAPLPCRYWWPPADCLVDLSALLSPDDPSPAGARDALGRLRPGGPSPADPWYARYRDWAGPGANPETDVIMAAVAGSLLGFRDA